MTSSLSKYEGKLPSPFNFFIEGHFHSILTLWSQPLVKDLFGDGYVWIIAELISIIPCPSVQNSVSKKVTKSCYHNSS